METRKIKNVYAIERNVYRKGVVRGTQIRGIETHEGEPLHIEIEMLKNNQGTIKAEKKLLYSPRAMGVLPASNVRTDRFSVALYGLSAIHKSEIAQRTAMVEQPKEEQVDESSATSQQ